MKALLEGGECSIVLVLYKRQEGISIDPMILTVDDAVLNSSRWFACDAEGVWGNPKN